MYCLRLAAGQTGPTRRTALCQSHSGEERGERREERVIVSNMEPEPQTWADNYEDFDNYEGYDEKPCSVCAVPGKTNGQFIRV